MIEGFNKKVMGEIVSNANATGAWPMNQDQASRFEALIRAEKDAIFRLGEMQLVMQEMEARMEEMTSRAKKARQEREDYCAKIEKDLSIPAGTRWKVNLPKQQIERE